MSPPMPKVRRRGTKIEAFGAAAAGAAFLAPAFFAPFLAHGKQGYQLQILQTSIADALRSTCLQIFICVCFSQEPWAMI